MQILEEKLKEIITNHKKWLRNEEGGIKAELKNTNLYGQNLSTADLRYADLAGSDLRSANLIGANLTGADLSGADFSSANMYSAVFVEADLEGAKFSHAIAGFADFSNSNLIYADFTYANLNNATFKYAELNHADFSNSDLSLADLTNNSENLKDINLHGAKLIGVKLPKGFFQLNGSGVFKECTTYDSINDQIIHNGWNPKGESTLAAFKADIERVYGAKGTQKNKQYYTEYMLQIQYFKALCSKKYIISKEEK